MGPQREYYTSMKATTSTSASGREPRKRTASGGQRTHLLRRVMRGESATEDVATSAGDPSGKGTQKKQCRFRCYPVDMPVLAVVSYRLCRQRASGPTATAILATRSTLGYADGASPRSSMIEEARWQAQLGEMNGHISRGQPARTDYFSQHKKHCLG